tara:strand:+ start:315 stop:515 length:201 start_codon:yes stop_codon:yes gene_type:complete
MTPFPRGRYASVETNINFLNAARARTLNCSAEVIERGKSIGLAQVKVTHGERLVRKETGAFTIRAK